MNILGAFFLKSGHFFKTLKKGGEDLPSPPAPSSSRQNTVMLDIWWHILIKFSKRLANTFEKIINFYKGEFKTLPNILDGAFWRNSQNLFTIFAKTLCWMFDKVLDMLLNWRPMLRMFHF